MLSAIFHGTFTHSNDAWFPWLNQELQKLSHKVIVPQFPTEQWNDVKDAIPENFKTKQDLESWLATFEEYLPRIEKADSLCFIGHSLGPLFILQIVTKYKINLENAIFVAPFVTPVIGQIWQVERANETFFKDSWDKEMLRKYIPKSTVIYSDNDPYISEGKSLEFAQLLQSNVVKVKGLGHMGLESGMKEFELVLDLIK